LLLQIVEQQVAWQLSNPRGSEEQLEQHLRAVFADFL
jgi:hypothetical protein